ncbi:hypothetical protein PE067_10475 [Paracoccus sp. DMF-8]|uniref:hypothetical protein n=1 Tax=Paracoccus sp. DMF-8 TaxID=3019445 RepID=UPI0023E8263C|nr:hypothetical protein [Paracoccus sp. DMF-8]MDF3606525.1 hypothetical protein [Paracoccus sp. DMF-8]
MQDKGVLRFHPAAALAVHRDDFRDQRIGKAQILGLIGGGGICGVLYFSGLLSSPGTPARPRPHP